MYTIWTYITDPIWNNEFHYDERIALWSEDESPASLGKIFIPSLITWNIDDLEEWSEIVFEETENWKLVSCTGLKHFIETSLFAKEGEGDSKKIPVYIVDNHNHALTFRYTHRFNVWAFERLVVIHIDQHADTKPNTNQLPITNYELPITEVEDFVNTKTNIGNFISAALNNRIINEVIQIRTEHALHHSTIQQWSIIVDIDVDFWEWKSDQEIESDFEIIRKLVDNACLITIATSPYFMDQKKAIEIIKQLLQ